MPPSSQGWIAVAAAVLAAPLYAQAPGARVLIVVNGNVAASREIGEYYRPRRSVPAANLCTVRTTSQEEIPWQTYVDEIERPIGECLKQARLTEQVYYIVTTLGVPLKITGGGSQLLREEASVDSELTLLYGKLKGQKFGRAGGINNPFFMKRDEPFAHPRFPIYLVTRLAAFDMADVKAMIDRSLQASNRGKFVIDLTDDSDGAGNDSMRTAGILLPDDRVTLDTSPQVLYDQRDVIGYSSFGSNDGNRKRRMLGFHWLPGAIATEFVSTDARTFERPPDGWTFGKDWHGPKAWHGSPQSLTADFIHEGATGASGHVYEPYLRFCPRPDYLLPAYYQGRNLAESFWLSIPALSWMNVVVGDPLCSLGKPAKKN